MSVAPPSSLLTRTRARLFWQLDQLRRAATVDLATRHVHGPRRIVAEPDEVVAVSLVRDAEYYLGPFLAHHRRLGIRRFLFIDNGSIDRTVEILSAQPDVTLMANHLPARRYECQLRARIARRVVRGGWFLFLDSDEMFGFPHDDERSINELAAYCNKNDHTAVVCQVIDHFSELEYSVTSKWNYEESLKYFKYFSINEILTKDYQDKSIKFNWFLKNNKLNSADLKFLFGGMRKEVFDEECCLTTHRLVKNDRRVSIYSHPHCSSNVSVSDTSAVLRHYKFCGPWQDRDQRNLSRGAWGHGEDRKRAKRVRGAADFRIQVSRPLPWKGTDALVEHGVLVCSREFSSKGHGHPSEYCPDSKDNQEMDST